MNSDRMRRAANDFRTHIALAAAAFSVVLLGLSGCAQDRASPPPQPGQTVRDCAECPEMVVLPSGTFTMGSPATERGRERDEGPQRRVTVASPFAIGKYPVTVGEFAAFVRGTNHVSEGCMWWDNVARRWRRDGGKAWRDPGFAQTDRHPVVCVSNADVEAYIAWLARKSGKTYRLPSEAEWEYAARAGTQTAYHWGDRMESGRANCNGCGPRRPIRQSSPVGGIAANGFGLNDMLGSVWQRVADCWHDTYAGAPADTAPWMNGANCRRSVVRGGSWSDDPASARAASRFDMGTGARRTSADGFRVARSL